MPNSILSVVVFLVIHDNALFENCPTDLIPLINFLNLVDEPYNGLSRLCGRVFIAKQVLLMLPEM